MTTRVIITSGENSNGDLHVHRPGFPTETLFPGQSTEFWVSTSSGVFLSETWPTRKDEKPAAMTPPVE